MLNRAPGEDDGEDLRAAEVRFARFFNSTPMAIASVDADGVVLRANGAFARLAPAALKPRAGEARPSIYRGVAERDHAALRGGARGGERRQGRRRARSICAWSGEAPARRGSSFRGRRSRRATRAPSATVFALDTTEQRTLQENFVQSQKMQAIGQLAGGIAHDFNNVLTAIIGYSDLLLANHRPTDPSFQDIMQIKQNANRAAGLVRQLLAFSRRQTLRPQTLQLGDVLSDLQMLLRRLVGETIELDVVLGRDLWLVKADLNQFEQVIVNLVVNARDAMSEGGKITLRTRNVAAAECARVQREVAGRPPNTCWSRSRTRATAFPPTCATRSSSRSSPPRRSARAPASASPWSTASSSRPAATCSARASPATARPSASCCRAISPRRRVEPAKKEPAKPAADLTGQRRDPAGRGRGGGARFRRARAGLARLHRARGANRASTRCESSKAGGKIDLIVSDVIMPEMDGPTMLTELRRRGLNAKIIFVSGYADDAFAKNLPEGEEFLFLPKPFTLKQLIETVKSAMS